MQQSVREADLLREYVQTGSGEAFSRLVGLHANMVYSASLRQVGDPALAEDVTQAVFIILARKAARLPAETTLAAWLHKVARYTALNALKADARRRRHERTAAEMIATNARPASPTWQRLSPLLDEGLSRLREADRTALILRYFRQQSMDEVGRALGVSEEAARMRVSRALDRLRAFFERRGVAVPAVALANVITGNAVQAAPAGVAKAAAETALQSATTAAAAATDKAAALASAAMRKMAWAKARFAAAAALAVLAVTVGTGVVLQAMLAPRPEPARWVHDRPAALPADAPSASGDEAGAAAAPGTDPAEATPPAGGRSVARTGQ